MTTQPQALRLAEYWETRAKDLQTWVDENDFVEFGYRPEGLKREQADQRRTAAELRRLHEVNQELLEVLKAFSDYVRDEQNSTDGAVTYSTTAINHWAFLARAATAKATGEKA